MRHLRAVIFDSKIMNDWVKYLPLVQRIINNKQNYSTHVSPASIITPGIDLDNALIRLEQILLIILKLWLNNKRLQLK